MVQSFHLGKKKGSFFIAFNYHILFLLNFFFCSPCGGKPESNFHSVLQEETGIDSSNNSQIQKDWSPKNFSTASQVTTVDADFKPMNQEFSLDQQGLNSVTSTGLSCGFPIGSASYGYPSTLIQSLYDPDPQPQPQNSLFTNPSISYSSASNYGAISSNELSPTTWSKVPNSLLKPSMPKQQPSSGLHFSNNTPFWNASAEALGDIRAGVFASSQAQYQTPNFEQKPNSPSTLLNKVYNGFQVYKQFMAS